MTNNNLEHDDLVKGIVAAILNARELAINIGSSSGVKLGMKFKVLADQPIEITDPETAAIIGIVDREKVRVQAIEVQNNLSVCRTYKTIKTGGGTLFSSMLAMSSAIEPVRTTTETLKVEGSSFPPPLSESESYVKRGDRVFELTKAEL